MAIKIPSEKIYARQNPKVRDNVIERIEVSAKEIEKKSNYSVTAYEAIEEYENTEQVDVREWSANDFLGKDNINESGFAVSYAFVACNIISTDYYNYIDKIIIPKQDKNNLIKKIRNWSYAVQGVKKTYNCVGIYNAQSNTSTKGYFSKSFTIGDQIEEDGINGNIYTSTDENKKEGTLNKTKDLSITAKIDIMDWSEVPQSYDEYNDYYEFHNIKVLAKKNILKLSAEAEDAGIKGQYSTWEATGVYIEYIPDSIKFIIDGDIVTIDIKDVLLYVPENDKTSKKVHSIDGNELMQTSNFYSSSDTNAITNAFTNTLNDYANGKETATIRCSISDYYDYDTDEKLISVDNSTKKMSFKLYDQVIPMVYTNNGDVPMSLYKDGTPKVFQVLGSKIYYDGAVWQELSLQEI